MCVCIYLPTHHYTDIWLTCVNLIKECQFDSNEKCVSGKSAIKLRRKEWGFWNFLEMCTTARAIRMQIFSSLWLLLILWRFFKTFERRFLVEYSSERKIAENRSCSPCHFRFLQPITWWERRKITTTSDPAPWNTEVEILKFLGDVYNGSVDLYANFQVSTMITDFMTIFQNFCNPFPPRIFTWAKNCRGSKL